MDLELIFHNEQDFFFPPCLVQAQSSLQYLSDKLKCGIDLCPQKADKVLICD